MLKYLISVSLEHRWMMILFAFGLAALGIYNYQRLPIDAVPGITNV